MSSRDHLIIKILPEKDWKTPGPARYSGDNGLTLTEYKPGSVYRVPDYQAWGMERRGWAKVIREEDIEVQDTADTTIEMSELRKKE